MIDKNTKYEELMHVLIDDGELMYVYLGSLIYDLDEEENVKKIRLIKKLERYFEEYPYEVYERCLERVKNTYPYDIDKIDDSIKEQQQ